jgi:hypothetical protein
MEISPYTDPATGKEEMPSAEYTDGLGLCVFLHYPIVYLLGADNDGIAFQSRLSPPLSLGRKKSLKVLKTQ